MRLSHTFTFVLVVGLSACGVFGSDDPTTNPPGNPTPTGSGPPGTPEQNAQPPGVNGAPLEGIFVSASRGADANDGTMAKPLKTIAAGLKAGKDAKKRVLICAEEYPEAITVLDGVSMYGYIDCGGPEWKVDDTKRATVKSPTSPAMRVENVSSATRIEGFAVIAPDFTEGSPDEREWTKTSSVGLFALNSTNIIIARSTIHSGTGRNGVDGQDGPAAVRTDTKTPEAGADEQNCALVPCASFVTNPGGAGGTATCTGGVTPVSGGKGGDGGHATAAGGWSAPPQNGANAGGTAGGVVEATVPSIGVSGDDGAAGSAGMDGENGAGSLTTEGLLVGDGVAGTNGGAGAPGGGGAAMGWTKVATNTRLGGSGGGGGAGGCPGLAGQPGLGGGASVALYVVKSSLSVERVRLESSRGGRAGRGTLGSIETVGQSPGTGGGPRDPGGTTPDCVVAGLFVKCVGGRGGAGGKGGRAGVSGHGAPGASYGIVHFGDAPKMDTETTITPGPGGEGAPELTRGPAKIPAMPNGASEKIVKGQ